MGDKYKTLGLNYTLLVGKPTLQNKRIFSSLVLFLKSRLVQVSLIFCIPDEMIR